MKKHVTSIHLSTSELECDQDIEIVIFNFQQTFFIWDRPTCIVCLREQFARGW